MLSNGRSKCSIQRPAPNISDGAGGFYSPEVAGTPERCTVQAPGARQREIAAQMRVVVTYVLEFRQGADIRIGDRVDVTGMPRLQVTAIPAQDVPGRKVKAVFCNIEGETGGQN